MKNNLKRVREFLYFQYIYSFKNVPAKCKFSKIYFCFMENQKFRLLLWRTLKLTRKLVNISRE